jgi:hypothetical protein
MAESASGSPDGGNGDYGGEETPYWLAWLQAGKLTPIQLPKWDYSVKIDLKFSQAEDSDYEIDWVMGRRVYGTFFRGKMLGLTETVWGAKQIIRKHKRMMKVNERLKGND